MARQRFVPEHEIRAAFSAAMSQMYREEVPLYGDLLEIVDDVNGKVLAADAKLAAEFSLPARPSRGERAYRLLSHCTEQALRPQSAAAWKAILGHFGIAAEPVRTGCCGMAGMFGHERENQAISRRLFELSWRDALGPDPKAALATGFSCRCQTKRLAGYRPHHPIEALRQAICGGA